MSESVIAVQGLRHTFGGDSGSEVPALDDVDLTVERGSFVVIVGANGSGKSTLLNAIAGTFIPNKGKVLLEGQDVTDQPAYRRATRIARVFQDPTAGTATNLTVAENLVLAMRRTGEHGLHRTLSDQRRREIAKIIGELDLDLEDRLDVPIGQLSGGQRQAVTLVMATIVRPVLLLLDEHTSALDPRSEELVLRLTQRIITRDKLTTLMVTHSVQQAVRVGTRLIVMHKGRIVEDLRRERKERLRVDDLLSVFDQLRYADQLDDSAARMLKRMYV